MPLHSAAVCHDRLEIVQVLRKQCCMTSDDIISKNLLAFALIQNVGAATFAALINTGVSPYQEMPTFNTSLEPQTPLHHAICHSDERLQHCILNAGLDTATIDTTHRNVISVFCSTRVGMSLGHFGCGVASDASAGDHERNNWPDFSLSPRSMTLTLCYKPPLMPMAVYWSTLPWITAQTSSCIKQDTEQP
jgi:hypothetical protein